MTRKYLPTLAYLIDTLSIITLKSIKLNHKKEFEEEAKAIMHDINLIMKEKKDKIKDWGRFIRAIQVNMLTNETIWQNESKNRRGNNEDTKALQLTHSINGMRRRAGNVISSEVEERIDLNLDTVLDEVCKKYGYDFSDLF